MEAGGAMSSDTLGGELLDLLFPPRCQICNRLSGRVICEKCLAQVEFIGEHFCAYCGQMLAPTEPAASLCRECRGGQWHSGARVAGLHVGGLREAVIAYKYRRRTRLVRPLARMLADVIVAEDRRRGLPLLQCAALVPVPLHPRRRAWRGFDQAELLCQHLGALIAMPVWADVLARVRNTTPQVRLSGASRLENVRGAFEARSTWKLRGRSVLLVDDVFTTGATVNECAAVLRAAGAAAVYALTVTRTAPDWHPGSLVNDVDPAAEERS